MFGDRLLRVDYVVVGCNDGMLLHGAVLICDYILFVAVDYGHAIVSA